MFLTDNGSVPVRWWTMAPNFGDLLSPWLVAKISGKPVAFADPADPHYLAIGSIIDHGKPSSVIWGSGSFGTEVPAQINNKAKYLAVRGPLTRNKLANLKIDCPRIYGDPALLVPEFYAPRITTTHEVGVILRWSENKWNDAFDGDAGIKKIFLKTDRIEETLNEILACKRIVSSSLHGLIIADAYGIPNAWLDSGSPRGLEFKFWDYLITVDKLRNPVRYDMAQPHLTANRLIRDLPFDGRPIRLDLNPLKQACPFW